VPWKSDRRTMRQLYFVIALVPNNRFIYYIIPFLLLLLLLLLSSQSYTYIHTYNVAARAYLRLLSYKYRRT